MSEMADTMVERGARAIYARRMSRPSSPQEYEETMADVRAAIEAMRLWAAMIDDAALRD